VVHDDGEVVRDLAMGGTVDLYAQWTTRSVSVGFVAAGVQVVRGIPLGGRYSGHWSDILMEIEAPADHRFVAWQLDGVDVIEDTDNDIVRNGSPHNLYARWERISQPNLPPPNLPPFVEILHELPLETSPPIIPPPGDAPGDTEPPSENLIIVTDTPEHSYRLRLFANGGTFRSEFGATFCTDKQDYWIFIELGNNALTYITYTNLLAILPNPNDPSSVTNDVTKIRRDGHSRNAWSNVPKDPITRAQWQDQTTLWAEEGFTRITADIHGEDLRRTIANLLDDDTVVTRQEDSFTTMDAYAVWVR
jgi:hypothetical protein